MIQHRDQQFADGFLLAFFLLVAFGVAVDAIETKVERAEAHDAAR